MRSNKKFQKSFWGKTYNGLLTRWIHFYFQIIFEQTLSHFRMKLSSSADAKMEKKLYKYQRDSEK